MSYFSIRKKILRRLFCILPQSQRASCLRKMGHAVGKNVIIAFDLYITDRSIDRGLLEIGDRVDIASGCRIITTSGPTASYLKEAYHLKIGKVVIKHDAWIGTNVVILPGVTIGEFSIIGAGTIVKADVPPFSVASGNPMTISPLSESFIQRIPESLRK